MQMTLREIGDGGLEVRLEATMRLKTDTLRAAECLQAVASLLPDSVIVVSEPDAAVESEMHLPPPHLRAWRRGVGDATAGVRMDENPYGNNPSRDMWACGWHYRHAMLHVG